MSTELPEIASSLPSELMESGSANVGDATVSGATKKSRPRRDDDMDTRLSKKFTFLLRHGADKAGLSMRPDGYSLVSDVVKCAQVKIDESKVLELVANDKKSRFGIMRDEKGALWIRANQGHTVSTVDREDLLKKVENASDYPVCIHGTSMRSWEIIKLNGLSRMKRNEIHCAKGGFGEVQSGFRASTQVLIYINLGLCLERDVPWYESENGVLLTPGIGSQGVLPTGYFTKVVEVKTSKELPFVPTFDIPEMNSGKV